jgi:hypothetical protein
MTSSAAMHKIVRIKTAGRIVYLLKPCNRRGKRQCDLKSNWVTPARNAGTSFGLEASHVSPLKQPRARGSGLCHKVKRKWFSLDAAHYAKCEETDIPAGGMSRGAGGRQAVIADKSILAVYR